MAIDTCSIPSSVRVLSCEGRGLTFDARHAHPIDDVVRETERDLLSDFKRASLRFACRQYLFRDDDSGWTYPVEETVEINVNSVSRRPIEQDIFAMSIAKSADMHRQSRSQQRGEGSLPEDESNHAHDGLRTRIRESSTKPG